MARRDNKTSGPNKPNSVRIIVALLKNLELGNTLAVSVIRTQLNGLATWALLGGAHHQVLNGVVDSSALRPSFSIGPVLIIFTGCQSFDCFSELFLHNKVPMLFKSTFNFAWPFVLRVSEQSPQRYY